MDSNLKQLCFDCENSESLIVKWKVKPGSKFSQGTVLMFYRTKEDREQNKPDADLKKWKASGVGTVIHLLKHEGDLIPNGCPVLSIKQCSHPIVMKDMCAECGADLRQEQINDQKPTASVAMVHSIPELMVSQEQAQLLGKADEERLVKGRRLVLLVDLDQTLIHTTNDEIDPNLKNVFHFKLYGSNSMWYHTKIRPGTKEFLKEIGQMYELHICTFGSRLYAHTVTPFIDQDGRFFSHRILSRDECCSANSKTANLSALFPCGVNLVCIIDDREDVWNFSPNLVHVKPYHYFQHTGDINAPPGLTKIDLDENGSAEVKVGNYKRSKQSEKCSKKVRFEKIIEKSESSKVTNESKINDETVTINKEIEKLEMDQNIEAAVDNINLEEKQTKNENGIEDTKLIEDIDCEMQNATTDSEERKADIVEEKSEVIENRTEAEDKTESAKDKGKDFEENVELNQKKSEIEQEKPEINHEKSENEQEKSEIEQEKSGIDQEKSVNEQEKSVNEQEKSVNEQEKSEIEQEKSEIDQEKSGNEQEKPEIEQEKFVVNEVQTSKKKSLKVDDEIKLVNDDHDDYLLYLTDILRTIHTEFYKKYDQLKAESSKELPDLREIVPATRKKTLKGAYIVFSGVVPINMPLEKSKPYFVARSLGAEIQKNIQLPNQGSQHATTHVVAARLGTVKVNEAKKVRGIHVVTPDWLWCCSERWERVDEKLFPLTKNNAVPNLLPLTDQSNPLESSDRLLAHTKNNKLKSQVPLIPCNVFPTYDPVTGKRINKMPPKPENSTFSQSAAVSGPSSASNANNFAKSINPLMTFSTEDIAKMGQEVDDELDDSASDESDTKEVAKDKTEVDDLQEQTSSSSSGESLSADYPRQWSRVFKNNKTHHTSDLPRYPRGELPHDSDESEKDANDSEDFADSIGSVDEEMVAAVEREFLNS
ncbi:hypothetical protein CHUAL_007387 [Chamberlinius hualienensis]